MVPTEESRRAQSKGSPVPVHFRQGDANLLWSKVLFNESHIQTSLWLLGSITSTHIFKKTALSGAELTSPRPYLQQICIISERTPSATKILYASLQATIRQLPYSSHPPPPRLLRVAGAVFLTVHPKKGPRPFLPHITGTVTSSEIRCQHSRVRVPLSTHHIPET